MKKISKTSRPKRFLERSSKAITKEPNPLAIKEKEDSKAKVVATLALVSLLVLMYVALHHMRPASSLTVSDRIITDINSAPIEYQFAYRDSGHLPRGTDLNAARIRYLLRSLAGKTGDSTQHIAERTSAATESLRQEYGREITHQRFLEEAHNYDGPKMNFDSLSTLVVADLGK